MVRSGLVSYFQLALSHLLYQSRHNLNFPLGRSSVHSHLWDLPPLVSSCGTAQKSCVHRKVHVISRMRVVSSTLSTPVCGGGEGLRQ